MNKNMNCFRIKEQEKVLPYSNGSSQLIAAYQKSSLTLVGAVAFLMFLIFHSVGVDLKFAGCEKGMVTIMIDKKMIDKKYMAPLWIKYPEISESSIGWRMGYGEAYAEEFYDWFYALSKEKRKNLKKSFLSRFCGI